MGLAARNRATAEANQAAPPAGVEEWVTAFKHKRDEIVAKARDLVVPVLGAETCGKFIDAIFALERIKDIRELRPLLQKG